MVTKQHVTLEESMDARAILRKWIDQERQEYADKKFAEEQENRHRLVLDLTNLGIGDQSIYMDFIYNYIKRASLLGIENPLGRQAFAKAIVSMMHLLEAAIILFGEMPKPGEPSGTVQEWK